MLNKSTHGRKHKQRSASHFSVVEKKYTEESDGQKPDARRIIYPELVIQMTNTMDRLFIRLSRYLKG